jgi:hypothetical protein
MSIRDLHFEREKCLSGSIERVHLLGMAIHKFLYFFSVLAFRLYIANAARITTMMSIRSMRFLSATQ